MAFALPAPVSFSSIAQNDPVLCSLQHLVVVLFIVTFLYIKQTAENQLLSIVFKFSSVFNNVLVLFPQVNTFCFDTIWC